MCDAASSLAARAMEDIDNCLDIAPAASSSRRIFKIIIYMQKKSSTGEGDLTLPGDSVETTFQIVGNTTHHSTSSLACALKYEESPSQLKKSKRASKATCCVGVKRFFTSVLKATRKLLRSSKSFSPEEERSWRSIQRRRKDATSEREDSEHDCSEKTLVSSLGPEPPVCQLPELPRDSVTVLKAKETSKESPVKASTKDLEYFLSGMEQELLERRSKLHVDEQPRSEDVAVNNVDPEEQGLSPAVSGDFCIVTTEALIHLSQVTLLEADALSYASANSEEVASFSTAAEELFKTKEDMQGPRNPDLPLQDMSRDDMSTQDLVSTPEKAQDLGTDGPHSEDLAVNNLASEELGLSPGDFSVVTTEALIHLPQVTLPEFEAGDASRASVISEGAASFSTAAEELWMTEVDMQDLRNPDSPFQATSSDDVKIQDSLASLEKARVPDGNQQTACTTKKQDNCFVGVKRSFTSVVKATQKLLRSSKSPEEERSWRSIQRRRQDATSQREDSEHDGSEQTLVSSSGPEPPVCQLPELPRDSPETASMQDLEDVLGGVEQELLELRSKSHDDDQLRSEAVAVITLDPEELYADALSYASAISEEVASFSTAVEEIFDTEEDVQDPRNPALPLLKSHH